jgi:hypothetical protein
MESEALISENQRVHRTAGFAPLLSLKRFRYADAYVMKMIDKSHPSGRPVADHCKRPEGTLRGKPRMRLVAATIQYVPTPAAEKRLLRAYQILLDLFPDVDNTD